MTCFNNRKNKVNYLFKQFYFAILLALLISIINDFLYGQQKWVWQNPSPQGADMFSAFTITHNRALLTGSGGTIITTNDSITNWKIQRLPKVDWVRNFSFITDNDCWIIGNWYDITLGKNYSKIFKSEDGGLNWQEIAVSINIDFNIYRFDGIEFINDQTGFLLANPSLVNPQDQSEYPGLIFKTEDGGVNWNPIDIGISRKYYQILFIDDSTGLLLSQPYYSSFDFDSNMLHKTVDGGKTWTTNNGVGYGVVNFLNDQHAWAGNYKTTDEGQTWIYQNFNFPSLNYPIDRIYFPDSLIGYAISYKTILKTEDGGNTWFKQKELENGVLQDIKFYDSNIGFVCGFGGLIYFTNDGGQSWNRYGNGVVENIMDVDFIDENIGWAVGSNGCVLHTLNGGKNWNKQNIPSECDSVFFRAITFIDSDKGWITGDNYILNTMNGGIDWQVQLKVNLEVGGRFRDIKFLNDSNGIAVGQLSSFFGPGIFYKTTDGGNNWLKIEYINLPPLDEIFIIDDYIWICGQGILLTSEDRGNSWQTNYFSDFLRYIQFTDIEHGWMSSIDEGAFYITTDGGKSWETTSFYNRFNQFISSFFFFNNNQGIATTFLFCNILSTKDNGINWSYQERLPPAQLNRITFINDTTGWAVGTNGAILKIEGSYFKTNNNLYNYKKTTGNYPNPFNSKTTIYFQLTQPQDVTISIYNLMGECFETFVITNPPKGINEIKWQPKNMVSGIYLIRIHCQEFSEVIKGLLIK